MTVLICVGNLDSNYTVGKESPVIREDKIFTCHFIDFNNHIWSHDNTSDVFPHNPKYVTFAKV